MRPSVAAPGQMPDFMPEATPIRCLPDEEFQSAEAPSASPTRKPMPAASR